MAPRPYLGLTAVAKAGEARARTSASNGAHQSALFSRGTATVEELADRRWKERGASDGTGRIAQINPGAPASTAFYAAHAKWSMNGSEKGRNRQGEGGGGSHFGPGEFRSFNEGERGGRDLLHFGFIDGT